MGVSSAFHRRCGGWAAPRPGAFPTGPPTRGKAIVLVRRLAPPPVQLLPMRPDTRDAGCVFIGAVLPCPCHFETAEPGEVTQPLLLEPSSPAWPPLRCWQGGLRARRVSGRAPSPSHGPCSQGLSCVSPPTSVSPSLYETSLPVCAFLEARQMELSQGAEKGRPAIAPSPEPNEAARNWMLRPCVHGI